MFSLLGCLLFCLKHGTNVHSFNFFGCVINQKEAWYCLDGLLCFRFLSKLVNGCFLNRCTSQAVKYGLAIYAREHRCTVVRNTGGSLWFWPNSFKGGTWGCQKIQGGGLFRVFSLNIIGQIFQTLPPPPPPCVHLSKGKEKTEKCCSLIYRLNTANEASLQIHFVFKSFQFN